MIAFHRPGIRTACGPIIKRFSVWPSFLRCAKRHLCTMLVIDNQIVTFSPADVLHCDCRKLWCFANRCIGSNQALDAPFQQSGSMFEKFRVMLVATVREEKVTLLRYRSIRYDHCNHMDRLFSSVRTPMCRCALRAAIEQKKLADNSVRAPGPESILRMLWKAERPGVVKNMPRPSQA